MILDTTLRKIQVVLGNAITTNNLPVLSDWVDRTAVPVLTPGFSPTLTNGTSAVDAVGVPGASTVREVISITIFNADTVAATVTVRYNDNATLYTINKTILGVGETLVYTKAQGWYVLDAAGNIKSSGAGGAGRFVKSTTLIAGTSFVTDPNTTQIFLRIQAGGGAGGGVATAATSGGGAGGGSAGGYAEKTFAVSPNTAYTYAIGAAGTPGAAGANPGGAGGNSTFIVGATTVTAFGGPGGLGITAAVAIAGLGGAAPAVSTNGDVNSSGAIGDTGFNSTAAVAFSGNGGSCLFGSGGAGRKTQGAGAAGVGRGAGGSGGCILSAGASVAGGAGLAGCIVVDEFS